MPTKDCPNCNGRELYETITAAGGSYGPNFLPSLARWWTTAQVRVVVCAGCGLTRLFALPPALDQLATSSKWTKAS